MVSLNIVAMKKTKTPPSRIFISVGTCISNDRYILRILWEPPSLAFREVFVEEAIKQNSVIGMFEVPLSGKNGVGE